MLFEEQRLEEVVDRMWVEYGQRSRPLWDVKNTQWSSIMSL